MSLEVKNLVKKYGDKTVVNDLSFTMDKPGVYALLGTNGAGKTTSIRSILGMLAFESGEILWNGGKLDTSKINVGYLAEERGLYPKYTLMDQLLYFAKLKGVSKEEAKKRIKDWAEKLQVTEYIYPPAVKGKKAKVKKAEELSKGNQQKIQLMAALISDPELLVLDEPLSGLDPVNADLFKNIIKEEVAKGKYIIMSSHQMATIEEFCEDLTIIDKGNVVLQGNLNEIKKSYGRVNLCVKVEGDIENLIKEADLTVVNKTPNEYQLKVNKEEDAKVLLEKILQTNLPLIKFELREPTLHEIFVEKVGNVHEE
ncbi:MAG: ATP-binding cassette domain-containing protein [Lachnospiraceae bacterium]|nr:ATP-binding cassette domain-containing protein [Lachnospiraceae bacterium]